MIIQCDKCATKFRLDESRITGNGVKVRCTKCQNVFIVTPPPPADEVQLEEVFGITTNPAAQSERPRQSAPRPRPQDKVNLKFDFSKGPSGEQQAGEDSPDPKEEVPSATSAPSPSSPSSDDSPEEKKEEKKFSFDNIDFSFARGPEEDSAGVEKEEGATPSEPSAPPAEEKKPAKQPVDFDFSFDEEEKATKDIKDEVEQEPPAPALKEDPLKLDEKEEEAFKVSIGKPEEKKAPENFSEVLSHTIAEGGDEPPFDEGAEEEVEAPKSRGRFALIAVLIVIVFGGGAVYFTGVIDMLARSLMPTAQNAEKTVEIETVNGFFTENKNFGRFFVIEAKIRNLTDKPQEIKAATGILYDGRGERLASRSVSPGRVLTPDDLKNLSSEEIQRAFKDPTGGSVPPKGVVPVMVPFTEVPEGLAECGVDVVR